MTPAARESLRTRSVQLAQDVLGLDVRADGKHTACPMHGGGSFHWYDTGRHFKCFGCPGDGYSGDIVDLTMNVRGVSLPEAERLLSDGRALAAMPRRASWLVPSRST